MYDLAIIGAGPAGAALACALAARWRVVLIDKRPTPTHRIGEALVPAAGRILRDFGLRDAFQALSSAPYVANRSLWGSNTEDYRDFISDPEGCGWHIDRVAFETMLRTEAKARGAECLLDHPLEQVTPGWHLQCGDTADFNARFVVDATGRSAVLARRLGAHRIAHDKMVARWCRVKTPPDTQTGISSVVTTPDGWWYHIAAKSSQSCESTLAFHSTSDLLPQGDRASFLDAAQGQPGLSEILKYATPLTEPVITAAHTARLDRLSGSNWIAIGDAGLCFDPIASRGIFHALYSAYVAAALIDERLRGHGDGFALYDSEMSRIYETYLGHRRAVYNTEKRWADTVFWRSAQA
ncbi:MAG: tryptophan 7-halogenase [Sulfitobacter sp.]